MNDRVEVQFRKHFVAWQAANVVNAPTIANAPSIVDRAFVPLAHVTRQRHLFDRARPGDAIWLIGRYTALSPAPASLIGCIVVEEKILEGPNFRINASPQSLWLGWNDASQLLSTVHFRHKYGARPPLPHVGLAQQFQTTREVAESSQEALTRFAQELNLRPKLFISYRWAASTELMKWLLPVVESLGYSVWIDRWSTPRRLNDLGKSQLDEAIEVLLRRAIEGCQAMLAITDDKYHSSKWTSFEYNFAKNNGVRICEFSSNLLNQEPKVKLVDYLGELLFS